MCHAHRRRKAVRTESRRPRQNQLSHTRFVFTFDRIPSHPPGVAVCTSFRTARLPANRRLKTDDDRTTRTTFAELKTRIRHSSATHHFSPPEPSSSIKPVFAFVARRICCHHLRHLSPRELSKPFFPHNRISNVSTCVGFQDPAAPRYAAKGFWYVLYFLCPNVSSPWRAILYLEYVRHSACTPILAVFDSDGNS